MTLTLGYNMAIHMGSATPTLEQILKRNNETARKIMFETWCDVI